VDDVLAMCERESITCVSVMKSAGVLDVLLRHLVLRQVKHRYPIAHGREQRVAIWGEDKVPTSIDGTQEIGEL